jgi:LPXTG-motif cell wall-anchored protein
MRRKHMIMLFTGALAAATAFGGTAAASSYPPDGSTATTVLDASSGSKPEAVVAPTAGELPQTGSDSDASMKLAAGALVAGVGLVVVAKRRRRPADA